LEIRNDLFRLYVATQASIDVGLQKLLPHLIARYLVNAMKVLQDEFPVKDVVSELLREELFWLIFVVIWKQTIGFSLLTDS
jgi:hypothetical protein